MEKKRKDFIPDIFFTKLRIFNKDYNISEFEKSKGNKREIVLKHDQNFFAVSFVAMDFINGENITIDGGMTKKMIYTE